MALQEADPGPKYIPIEIYTIYAKFLKPQAL